MGSCSSRPSIMASDATSAPSIAIVYYSMYGHILKMAASVQEGLEEAGCKVTLLQAPELLTEEVLGKMHAPPKADHPIADPSTLGDYDGIIFGLPTRFGMAASQMKALMDATGGLWQSGALVGKPAGIFFSTGTQNGGQETTAFTWISQLTHHGMVYVPMGYSNPTMFDMTEPHGGSPWGPGTLAGPDGSRQPSELELGLGKHYGTHYGKLAAKLK